MIATSYVPSQKLICKGNPQYSLDKQKQVEFDRLLTQVDVVSFDLFDTLIHRKDLFSPKDLFYYVQAEAEKQLDLKLDDFTALRVRAEERARVRLWGRSIEEVELAAIYSELGRMLSLTPQITQALQQIELAYEKAMLMALESGAYLMKTALAANKQIIIVTDTYFSENFIRQVVEQAGYRNITKIYVSSVYGKTKQEGSLFDLVLNDLGCSPKRVLHVGDNRLSDMSMALGKGLRAFFVPTVKHRLKWRCGFGDELSGDLTLSTLLCEISSRMAEQNEQDDLQVLLPQTGHQSLSILYYSFAAWLLAHLKRGGYSRVYFAARDGLIMKRFFDLVASAAGFEIDSRYLYVSRVALYPSLIFTEPATARHLFSHSWDDLTIEEALSRISLKFDDVSDLLAECGLHNRKLSLNEITRPKFDVFLKKAWPLLEHANQESFSMIETYMRQEMMLTEEKVAFVDIGWHGSLQNCLVNLLDYLGIEKKIDGYYLGTFKKPKNASAKFRAKGFLVENDEPHDISHLVRHGPSVIELFHSADHGSVMSYRREGELIKPVLEDNQAEQEQYQTLIKPVQEAAFDFVEKLLESKKHFFVSSPNPGLTTRAALRFVYNPTLAEATLFGRLKIVSDFGGRLKSITGASEWNLKEIEGDLLPDGTVPIWRSGFQVLKERKL
ncbi:MAG: HAD-IA family hydrolase [Anaerolineae bacterium]|nr:HAD-IA family hydrolase [Anaerolineae bacterium]